MKKRKLKENYDYNGSIKKKTDYIAENVYNLHGEIEKSKLFNLAVNLCNQMIYDYIYIFSKDDLYFISEYNINIQKLIDACIEDAKIMYYREREEY
ncbi:unknown [Clostridium sp. CAG:921]|nr:unknown [Clostridium sp. CAG:921]